MTDRGEWIRLAVETTMRPALKNSLMNSEGQIHLTETMKPQAKMMTRPVLKNSPKNLGGQKHLTETMKPQVRMSLRTKNLANQTAMTIPAETKIAPEAKKTRAGWMMRPRAVSLMRLGPWTMRRNRAQMSFRQAEILICLENLKQKTNCQSVRMQNLLKRNLMALH